MCFSVYRSIEPVCVNVLHFGVTHDYAVYEDVQASMSILVKLRFIYIFF